MIKLYREKDSPQADAIEAEFRELVLGYDRVVVDADEGVGLFDKRTLPVITDNERVVNGDEVPAYIKELTQLMSDWQLFQGDYCYVNDDGKSC